MKRLVFTLLAIVVLVGCRRGGRTPTVKFTGGSGGQQQEQAASLTEARRGFRPRLVSRGSDKEPAPQPPPHLFHLVHYESPVGKLAAYLTPDPGDGKKHPAIIWITGGDCNSIDQGCWQDQARENDQSASAFRKAGIIMMFPSLRGGNDNPGNKEGFLGEVDDVLAAADFLGKQSYVDPNHIYLGGHSTGGTLVLLVAECSDRFRAIFSFGPADNVAGYPPQYLPFDTSNPQEIAAAVAGPVAGQYQKSDLRAGRRVQGNIGALNAMSRSAHNPNVHFLPVRGATHLSILAPTNRLLAAKILRDDGPTCNLAFAEQEVSKPFGR